MRAAGVCIALALATVGCSNGGTYVLVDISGTNLPEVASIELDLDLGGAMANTTLANADHTPIALPTSATLQIGSGTGMLTAKATARDAAGKEVASGTGSVAIVAGGTVTMSITLAGGTMQGDGGRTPDLFMGDLIAPVAHLVASQPSLDFGDTVVGAKSALLSVTITNGGATASAALATNFPAGTEFTLVTDNCNGKTLTPLGQCTLSIEFAPTMVGAASSMVGVSEGANDSLSVMLAGNGLAPGALTIAPLSQDFGSSVVGTVAGMQMLKVTNTGGSASGMLTTSVGGGAAADFVPSGDACMGKTLAAKASCTMTVTFTPSAQGARAATLTVSGTPGGSAVATLTGTGLSDAAITIAPAMQDFGSLVTGQASAALPFVVTNGGGVTTGTITTSLAGANDFQVVTDGCKMMTLPPNGSCTITVRFTAGAVGNNKTATLTATAAPGGSTTAMLSGTSLAPSMLTIAPNNKDYTTIDVGMSANQTFTVTNMGGSATGALMVTPPGGDFQVSGDTCSGKMLAANGTCTIGVSFVPSAFGSKNATLVIAGNPGGTAAASLTGIGRDKVQLTITRAGTGSGKVTAPAAGSVDGMALLCPGGLCSDSYYRTTSNPTVTLTAAADPGSTFGGWNGGNCAGMNPVCTVTLSTATTVTATFTLSTFPLTVTVAGPGTVNSNPPGINNCVGVCTASFASTVTVTLSSAPMGNFSFLGYMGDCNGVNCSLLMNASHNVTADFSGCGQMAKDGNTIGLWHLDDGAGQTVSDSSGNGHNGTLGAAAMPSADDPKWGPGRFGGGLLFDTTNCGAMQPDPDCQWVQIPTGAIPFPNGFTVELWFKPLNPYGSAGGFGRLFGTDNISASVEAASGNFVDCSIGDGNNWFTLSNNIPNYGDAWHYVAQTWDGMNQTLYLDGQVVLSGKMALAQTASTDFQFGGRPYNTFLNGVMDEIRISNVARTQAQIQGYYTAAAVCP
jgi:hypothetical protein